MIHCCLDWNQKNCKRFLYDTSINKIRGNNLVNCKSVQNHKIHNKKLFCLLTFWANKTERRQRVMSRGIVSQNVLCIHSVVDARCRIYMFQFSWYGLQRLKLNEYTSNLHVNSMYKNPLYLVTYEIYKQLSIIPWSFYWIQFGLGTIIDGVTDHWSQTVEMLLSITPHHA